MATVRESVIDKLYEQTKNAGKAAVSTGARAARLGAGAMGRGSAVKAKKDPNAFEGAKRQVRTATARAGRAMSPTSLTRTGDKAKARVRETAGRAGKSISDVGQAARDGDSRRNWRNETASNRGVKKAGSVARGAAYAGGDAIRSVGRQSGAGLPGLTPAQQSAYKKNAR